MVIIFTKLKIKLTLAPYKAQRLIELLTLTIRTCSERILQWIFYCEPEIIVANISDQ